LGVIGGILESAEFRILTFLPPVNQRKFSFTSGGFYRHMRPYDDSSPPPKPGDINPCSFRRWGLEWAGRNTNYRPDRMF
jgi:hypothetical protein